MTKNKQIATKIMTRKCADKLTGEHIVIPDGYTAIEAKAFASRRGVASISLPGSLTMIGYGAFDSCSSLKNITIPVNVTEIGGWAFYATALTSIVVPASVTEIGDYAFERCDSLTDITVSADNQNYASFEGVLFNKEKTTLIFYPPSKADKTYTIPDTVSKIGDKAFEGNAFLTKVTIPESVRRIESKAFAGCSDLTEMFIPASVEHIHQYVFNHCDALESIIISEDNPNYTSEHKVLFNKDKTMLIEYSDREMEDNYVIPDSVKIIDWFAFCGCESLKSVVIPEGVESIGMHAFEGCRGLTEIVLPSSMTLIDHDTFSKCRNLRKITIPDSIIEVDIGPIIEAHPFYGCHPQAVATYKGKTYHAEELFSRIPYTNLPKEFYEAFSQTPPNPNALNVIVSIGSDE